MKIMEILPIGISTHGMMVLVDGMNWSAVAVSYSFFFADIERKCRVFAK